jgi:hypothetical protein
LKVLGDQRDLAIESETPQSAEEGNRYGNEPQPAWGIHQITTMRQHPRVERGDGCDRVLLEPQALRNVLIDLSS